MQWLFLKGAGVIDRGSGCALGVPAVCFNRMGDLGGVLPRRWINRFGFWGYECGVSASGLR